jgi:hypothetical protein
MAADPVTLSAPLQSTAPPDEVLARLRRLPMGSSARFEQPDPTTLVIYSGSKLRYRLLGAWSSKAHLPLKVRFELDPRDDGTSVHFTLTSEAGWYLIQTPMGRKAYQARFAELLTVLTTNGVSKGA